MITASPSRSSPLTSVRRPSLRPAVTATATGAPSRSTHSWRSLFFDSTDPLRLAAPRGARGISLDTRPPPPPPGAAAAGVSGVKRSAAFGTSSTSSRCTAAMLAVAVMPGRSSSSALSTLRSAT